MNYRDWVNERSQRICNFKDEGYTFTSLSGNIMYYGFDIGGTKIEFGAFNQSLERVASERIPTATDNYEQLLQDVVALVKKYDQELQCEGQIGIGIPGIEKASDGTVLTSNIPTAKGKTLRKRS